MPDLIVVDGGAPQINAVCDKVLDLPIIGMAKDNDEIIVSKTNSHVSLSKIEELATSESHNIAIVDHGEFYSINLHVGAQHSAGHSFTFLGSAEINPYTDLLKLLQRLRDESHRFAITYHQSLKRKRQTSGELDNIPGVGPITKRKLLRHFGSVTKIKTADENELAKVVGAKLAHVIHESLVL